MKFFPLRRSNTRNDKFLANVGEGGKEGRKEGREAKGRNEKEKGRKENEQEKKNCNK